MNNSIKNCKVMCEDCKRWFPVEQTKYNEKTDGNVCVNCSIKK